MAVCTATFEAGANGATVSTGDAGSATPWNVVQIDANATVKYDNAHAYGSMASKIVAATGSPCRGYLGWTTAFGTQTNHYGRFYIYPSQTWQTDGVFRTSSAADFNTQAAALLIDTGNNILIRDSNNVNITGTAVPLVNGSWNRVEYHVIHSLTVGQIEIKTFIGANANGTTPTETITTAANLNTLANGDGVYFGLLNNDAPIDFWLDHVVAGASAYPGPAPTSVYSNVVLADNPVAYYRMDEASGQLQDSSGHSLPTDDTITGAATYSRTGAITSDPSSTAILFDGSDAFARTDNALLDLGDVFTLEAWVKRASIGAQHNILSKGNGCYDLRFDTDNTLNMLLAFTTDLVHSTTTITDTTTFHHLVGTKNGATMKLYIDGVDVTGTPTNNTGGNNLENLRIGEEGGGFNRMNGTMDEIAIYPTALSAARVLAHYQAAIGTTTGLRIASLSAVGW